MDEEKIKEKWKRGKLSRKQKYNAIVYQYDKGHIYPYTKKVIYYLIDEGLEYDLIVYIVKKARIHALMIESCILFKNTNSFEKVEFFMNNDFVEKLGIILSEEEYSKKLSPLRKLI